MALRRGFAQIPNVFGDKLKDRCLLGSSSGLDCQALVLMVVGLAVLRAALEALVALKPMLSRTLGLSSLTLELVLFSAQA